MAPSLLLMEWDWRHWQRSGTKSWLISKIYQQWVMPKQSLAGSNSSHLRAVIARLTLSPSCWVWVSRPANLRVGQLCEIVNGAIFGSMITYMRLVKMGQKSQAFLTQMVQFWWGNCMSLTLRSLELAGLQLCGHNTPGSRRGWLETGRHPSPPTNLSPPTTKGTLKWPSPGQTGLQTYTKSVYYI